MAYWEAHRTQVQRQPDWLKYLEFFGIPGIAFLTTTGAISRFLRGGELVLRPAGLVLRYRKDVIFCPWALFQTSAESWRVNASDCTGPAWTPAVPTVVHGRRGTVVATGLDVRTKPLCITQRGRLIFTDLYSVYHEQIIALLLHLGERLGPGQKLGQPPAVGDPLLAEGY
jgi:hypothetical protein